MHNDVTFDRTFCLTIFTYGQTYGRIVTDHYICLCEIKLLIQLPRISQHTVLHSINKRYTYIHNLPSH